MNHRDLRKRTYDYPVEFFKKSILKNCHLDLGNRVDLLYSGLVSNKDQLVLLDRVSLIEKFEKNEGITTKTDGKNIIIRRVGIIREPYLKIGRDDNLGVLMELIVDQHFVLYPIYYEQNIKDLVELDEGGIKISGHDYTREKIVDKYKNIFSTREIKDFSIYIGNKEVRDFILENYPKKGSEIYDYIYSLSTDLEKLVEKKEEMKVLGVVRTLECLLDEERILKKQIDFIYNSIENGGFEFGNQFVPIESDDDAFIATYSEQELIKSARKDIRGLLKNSIKRGLHLNPYEYLYEHKSGKVTKNISEFILELNERYSPQVI